MNNIKSFYYRYRIAIAGIVAISVLTSIGYSNIFAQQFLNWDDIDYVLKNSHVKAFTLDNIIWMFSDFSMANWHPLTWLSYTFNYTLWGNNPVPYKVTNILIHIVNSIIVYIITRKILSIVKTNYHYNGTTRFSLLNYSDIERASILAAILFAIHPSHVESVTWISERKDVLYSFFFLLTIWFYIRFRETNNITFLSGSILLFVCALMAKSMSVTTPLILILIDIYPLRLYSNLNSFKSLAAKVFAHKTTFFILAILVSIITLFTQSSGIQSGEQIGLDARIINASMSILLYIYHFFWPVNLSTFYSYHPWSTDPNLFSILPVLTVIYITIWFCYLAVKKNTYFPIISWFYFIITLLPVIGIIKVGGQAAADRYTYMPLLPLFIITATGFVLISHYIRNFATRTLFEMIITSSICACLVFLTYNQNNHWKNDETLWKKAISDSPGTAGIPYANLGAVYFRRGESRAAITELNKSLAVRPGDIKTMEQVGKAYELMGERKLAINTYKELIKQHPNSHLGYIRLGDVYYRMRELDTSKKLYRKAFSIMPTLPSTLQRSALADYFENKYAAAEQKLSYMLQINPDNIGGLQLMAKIKVDTGQYLAAQLLAKKILANDPKNTFAYNLLRKIQSNSEI